VYPGAGSTHISRCVFGFRGKMRAPFPLLLRRAEFTWLVPLLLCSAFSCRVGAEVRVPFRARFRL